MAPPLKRRRLFFWQEDMETDSSTNQSHGFAHAVTEIEPAQPSATPSRPQIDLRELLIANVRNRQVEVDFAVSVASEQSVSTATPTSSATPQAPQSSTILSASDTTSAVPASSIASLPPATSTPISTSSTLSSSTTLLSSISSSPTITSSSSFATFSASANSTLAENILASNLSSSTTSFSSASSGFFSYSNSSSSTTTDSSTSTDDSSSSTDNVAATTVLTTQTFSSDGQPVSTITSAIGVAGNGANPATPSQSAGLASNSGGASDPPPPGTIAGGVVGGAAGLAILLLVAMLLLRWYRRRNQFGHTQVPQTITPGYSDAEPSMSRGPGMAEQAGLRPWAAAVPALFRHQQAAAPAAVQERGFQRVSGRKLPSAWSPGMESTPPVPQRNYSRHVATSTENPFSDRPGSNSPEDMIEMGRQPSDEQMTVMPGAHRRPTIHDPQSPPLQGENNANLWPRHTSAIARTSGGDFAGISQETIHHTFGDGRATNFTEDI